MAARTIQRVHVSTAMRPVLRLNQVTERAGHDGHQTAMTIGGFAACTADPVKPRPSNRPSKERGK